MAMLLGTVLGLLFKADAAAWFGWLGDAFIRLLKMVIVPLVFSSLVTGLMELNHGRELRSMGLKTMALFISTSLFAILLGLLLMNLIQPGVNASLTHQGPPAARPNSQSIKAMLLDMIPTNILQAMSTDNMIGIILFAILFGLAVRHISKGRREIMINWFNSFYDVMITMTNWIINLAPLGVTGLVAKAVGQGGLHSFQSLGLYMLTIFSGLVLHMFGTMSLLLIIFARINPLRHINNMLPALLTAFSTSSSSATLPVTIKTLRTRVGVSNKVSSFVLPMGATINMDGTALYECAGVLFIAQVLKIPLDLTQQIMLVFVALIASIGAAGIPSAGLVMIFIVLEAVNLNTPEAHAIVGIMLAIDRPLDMCRTAVNVYGDTCVAAIIAKSDGEHLNE